MKILITGITGLVGSALADELRQRHDIIAAVRRPLKFEDTFPKERLDLNDSDTVKEAVEAAMPDAVIHCAGMTSPDECEQNRKECERINAQATAELAVVCREVEARLVFLSTDQVFSGAEGWYTETHKPAPVNFYGATKFSAENAVRKILSGSIIARLPYIYGKGRYGGDRFTEWIVESLRNGREVHLFKDRFRSHFYLGDCVRALTALLEGGHEGLFHLSGGNRESRYEFGVMLAEIFGLDESLIVPVQSDDPAEREKCLAERPRDISLHNEKLLLETRFAPLTVEQGLENLKKILSA